MSDSAHEPTTIHVVCPKCQTEGEVPIQYAGRQGRCRVCGSTVAVPRPPNAADESRVHALAPTSGTAHADIRDLGLRNGRKVFHIALHSEPSDGWYIHLRMVCGCGYVFPLTASASLNHKAATPPTDISFPDENYYSSIYNAPYCIHCGFTLNGSVSGTDHTNLEFQIKINSYDISKATTRDTVMVQSLSDLSVTLLSVDEHPPLISIFTSLHCWKEHVANVQNAELLRLDELFRTLLNNGAINALYPEQLQALDEEKARRHIQ